MGWRARVNDQLRDFFDAYPLVAAAIALGMGLASLAIAVNGYQTARNIDEKGIETLATVEDFEFNARDIDRLKVTFSADGRPVHTAIEWNRGRYAIGQPVGIIYDESDPTNAEQAGGRSIWSRRSAPMQLFFLAGGLLFLFVSGAHVLRAVRRPGPPANAADARAMQDARDRAVDQITDAATGPDKG